jgi:hypothetical protein
MNNPHVCFSGSNACSGCNPCEMCAKHVRMCVLPVAMIAGGFNQDDRQSEAFFEGYKFGWQRLHDAMMQDPELKQQYVARELIIAPQQEIPPFGPGAGAVQHQSYPMAPDPSEPAVQHMSPTAQQYYPHVRPDGSPGFAQPTINGAAPPILPTPPVSQGLEIDEADLHKPLDLSAVKTLLDEAEKRQTGGAVEVVANPRVRNMTRPTSTTVLDAEQIASAAAPVVLGDVMNIPK